MVVECQAGAFHVRQIGRDVALGDFDLAVLHVLGVDELDLVDQFEFIQQYGANQPVKIAAGDQSVFLLTHGGSSVFDGCLVRR